MNRMLRIAAAFAIVATLGACSSTEATEAPTAVQSEAPQSQAPKTYEYADMVVGFIQTGSESGWRAANTSSFKETATALGIDLKFYDSQNKIENQITAFKQFNQDSSVNVIVLAAVDVTGYDAVLKEAQQAGKVVVIEDRRIDADSSLYYTYIGSDFVEEGHKVAAAMCDLLKDSETKNVVEIGGDQGASAAIDRGKGFAEANDCGMNILASQYAAGWDPTVGKQIMEGFLTKYPDQIDGVFGHNDELAIAGIQAAKAAGLVPAQDIYFIGVDATANGFKYLISGELSADIECNPLLAPQVYKAALDGLNGVEGTPKWVPSEESEFFASQGADELQQILDTRKY